MTGVDIHALSGAYALDALEDLERAAFRRHLAQCPACTVEVAELRDHRPARRRVGHRTPAQLRARVLAEIAVPGRLDRPKWTTGGRAPRGSAGGPPARWPPAYWRWAPVPPRTPCRSGVGATPGCSRRCSPPTPSCGAFRAGRRGLIVWTSQATMRGS
jgi:anti-sigma factor RsiW